MNPACRPLCTMREALADPAIFGEILPGETWAPWRAILIASRGEALTDDERVIFTALTGREREPEHPVDELWGIVGRRGGKSRAFSVLGSYLAGLVDYGALAAPGERVKLPIMASTTVQAAKVFSYVLGVFTHSAELQDMVDGDPTSDTIRLRGGVDIEVRPANKTIRGETLAAALCDEVAFWHLENSANPDTLILDAIRPGLPAESDGTITTHGHRWKPGANSAGGKERVASWLKFFQAPVDQGGMGADLETSRAMVAMMQGESGANLDPTVKGDNEAAGNPTSFGTAQWHAERFEQLKAFAARMKVDWTDVGAQQQFLRHEFLQGRYQGVWNRIKGAPTGEAKLRAGIEGYERPKYPGKAYDFRVPNLHALRRSGVGVVPAEAANSKIVVPPPSTGMRGAPNMTPGGFDPNNIDPANLMKLDPATSPAVVNNSTSSSRSVNQTFNSNTTITGAENPRQAASIMESAFGRMHGLALQNAQSATV